MKILIVIAHPDKNSLNHAIANTVLDTLKKNKHESILIDLYKEKFDAMLPSEEIPSNVKLSRKIDRYCTQLKEAEGIIIVHPNWWGQPPAILKGWVDRVFRPDIAYKFVDGDNGEGIPVGLLKASSAIVFNTSNTPKEREKADFGDPLERLWKDCIFNLCGVQRVYRKMFSIVITSTEHERTEWLNEVKKTVSKHYPGAMK